MPWIQHFSRSDIKNGTHYDPGQNTVLITITDIGTEHVIPTYKFAAVYPFTFEDTEDETSDQSITQEQAEIIAKILRLAYEENMNVAINCIAGLCRSSAVAVAGQQIGFQLEDKVRMPNSLVKKKVYTALGLYFDPTKSPFNLPDPYGILYEPKDYD